MLKNKQTEKMIFQSLIILIRVLFGFGWLLAGVTKISNKSWFNEPGIFLSNYLHHSLNHENVPQFYKHFLEHIALEHVFFLNYAIPIVQILVGISVLLGIMTVPSILLCLFMHINFILSGNMNLISLVLYTSAFSLLLGRKYIYFFSLDHYLGLVKFFNRSYQREGNLPLTDTPGK